jgi:hypothetical protein
MKLVTLAFAAAIAAIPSVAFADSSQPKPDPNSAAGKQMQKQESMQKQGAAKQQPRATTGSGTTGAGMSGKAGTSGAADSSIPGATNPNEPMQSKK